MVSPSICSQHAAITLSAHPHPRYQTISTSGGCDLEEEVSCEVTGENRTDEHLMSRKQHMQVKRLAVY